VVGKEEGPAEGNCQRSGRRLTEDNCQYSVVCALRIRKATPFSLKKVYLYLILAMERIWIDIDFQLFSLNQ